MGTRITEAQETAARCRSAAYAVECIGAKGVDRRPLARSWPGPHRPPRFRRRGERRSGAHLRHSSYSSGGGTTSPVSKPRALPIPWTLEVLTGSGGGHYYFAPPPGPAMRNSAERIGRGLDVRGEGGYVIAPPSMRESGARYSWCENGAPFARLEGWLLAAMGEPVVVAPTWVPGRWEGELEKRLRRAVAYV